MFPHIAHASTLAHSTAVAVLADAAQWGLPEYLPEWAAPGPSAQANRGREEDEVE